MSARPKMIPLARLLAAALLLGPALHAGAATPRAPVVAVPYYSAEAYGEGLLRGALPPRAARFAEAAAAIEPALRPLCDVTAATDASTATRALGDARRAWARAVGTWEDLSTVAIDAVAERRSARQIDFTPTRPELIERAIRKAPADAAAMETIGSAAKGFPALEWLLWKQPPAAGSGACAYARQVALDIAREADALQHAYAAAAPSAQADDEAAADPARAALLGEALNQWLGGIEALRGKHMERPLRGPATIRNSGFPREASGLTAASWQQQWQTLRSFAAQPADQAPTTPGTGLVPFETYLRGVGLNPLADRLARQVRAADASMRGLSPAAPTRVRAAAKSLASLRHLVEGEVAAALKITLGFSDADGD